MDFIQALVDKWKLNDSETALRSFVKAYSYRCCGTLTTIVISYIITRQIVVSIVIGFTEIIIKPFIYWAHERVWSRVKWGKKQSQQQG